MANNNPIVKTIKAQYVFANDAGGTGDRTLTDSPTIPDNSIILSVATYVSTAFGAAAGTPTVAVKIGGQTVVAAQNYNHASFADEAVTVTAAGTWAKTTSATKVIFTVGTNALDAGVVDVYVSYIENAAN